MIKYNEMRILMEALKEIADRKFNINFYDDDSMIKVEISSRFEDFELLKDLFENIKKDYYYHIILYSFCENILIFKWSFIV